jgi:hypothetical protein
MNSKEDTNREKSRGPKRRKLNQKGDKNEGPSSKGNNEKILLTQKS